MRVIGPQSNGATLEDGTKLTGSAYAMAAAAANDIEEDAALDSQWQDADGPDDEDYDADDSMDAGRRGLRVS
jgi:hypothetical protein